MAFSYLRVTIKSAKDLAAPGRRLALSLSGDERNQKQFTSVNMEGSTFELIVEDVVSRVEFKIEESTFSSNNEVVGAVDVPLMDLLAPVWDLYDNGCVGDMEPRVLSLEVRSSSPETNGRIMGVLELSYKFGQQFSVEAPPESSAPRMRRPPMAYEQNAAAPPATNPSETVTASQQTAPPNYQAALPQPWNTGVAVGNPVGVVPPAFPPNGTASLPIIMGPWGYPPNAPLSHPHYYGAVAGYGPVAQPPPQHPGRNFVERLAGGVLVHVISSRIDDPGSDGGDFTFPGFDT